MIKNSYDVIVIGARCGGAPTAMLLARQGLSVLLIEREATLGDVLSTHFLWPRAASYLNRWGLLAELTAVTPASATIDFALEDRVFRSTTPSALIAARLAQVHGPGSLAGEGATNQSLCVRRRRLDPLLAQAATQAGATLLAGTATSLIKDATGRVIGVEGYHQQTKASFSIMAPLVIGADGRGSLVARDTKAATVHTPGHGTFAYWGYFTDVPLTAPVLMRRGRLAAAMAPTNDGAVMTLVWGPAAWWHRFRQKPAEHFHAVLQFVHPELGDRVQRGRQVERFWGTGEQQAYCRQSHGPGWLLVGDSASFKDQCGAVGITHAFRDAELAAAATMAAFANGQWDQELASYSERRSADLMPNFEMVCHQALMTPATPGELALYDQLAAQSTTADQFVALLGDSLSPAAFGAIAAAAAGDPVEPHEARPTGEELFAQPTTQTVALSGTGAEYLHVSGADLVGRTSAYYDWWKARSRTNTWQYGRTLAGRPGPTASLVDEEQRRVTGINFASQDYLALGSHPEVKAAALAALAEFGPHSAGSAVVCGNTTLSRQLEAQLAEHVATEHVVLYPTGWMAGFGVITGLVRKDDHIVLDHLAHACLQQGARAATGNIHRHAHLDVAAAKRTLQDIRAKDRKNAILVVSEGLFSMDSDTPDLWRLQEACHEYEATLLVDVAHDLGALGPQGTGQLGVQQVLGKVDLVMGAFSKTFATNGGFVASRSPAVREYLRMFSFPHVFSNALSPLSAAVASKTLEIVRSVEGDQLRAQLLQVVQVLRQELASYGLEAGGIPSPIVPINIGDERLARLTHRLLSERGAAAMIIEYPVVAVGKARLRLQAMASHTEVEARQFAALVATALVDAAAQLQRFELLGDRQTGNVLGLGLQDDNEAKPWPPVRSTLTSDPSRSLDAP